MSAQFVCAVALMIRSWEICSKKFEMRIIFKYFHYQKFRIKKIYELGEYVITFGNKSSNYLVYF